MCGIGGVKLANSGWDSTAMKTMFGAMAERGRHAHGLGIMYENSDNLIVNKSKGSSRKNLHKIEKFGSKNVEYMMMHTRFTTSGSVDNNYNNHPVVNHDIVLTHNGVVEDYEVFPQLPVQPDFEVDTECINAALRYKGIQWVAENIHGSMSLIWVDRRDSLHKINFFTNGLNPLVFARDEENNLYWASNESYFNDIQNIKNVFHAIPFKHYWIDENNILESKFVSDERREPRVITPYFRYTSENTSVLPSKTPYNGRKYSLGKKRFKPKKKAQNWKDKSVFGGMIYDEKTDSWKNWR